MAEKSSESKKKAEFQLSNSKVPTSKEAKLYEQENRINATAN
jgi:hypothetical protein